jgi:hypothetical protein
MGVSDQNLAYLDGTLPGDYGDLPSSPKLST